MTTTAPAFRYKIGQNRGRARIWLDGQRLAAAGFLGGTGYLCEVTEGEIRCTVLADADRPALPKGTHDAYRKVTGRPDGKPIIDMVGGAVSHAFPGASAVLVRFGAGRITITAAPAA